MNIRVIHQTFLVALFLVSNLANAGAGFEQWITDQNSRATKYLVRNINPVGTLPGTVVASPSKDHPDYFYHWVRDAARVMNTVITLYESADESKKALYKQHLHDFIELTKVHQAAKAIGSLGEPKYYVDGTAYEKPWGRPQNDGPALRASALIRFAKILIGKGESEYVKHTLYNSKSIKGSIIKEDLEYVSHHWRDTNFDLWEEIRGDHFYTRFVQRKALIDGAELAKSLGDPKASEWYLVQAKDIEKELERHWDSKRQRIVATVNYTGGANYKHSGLDSSVILAILHADTGDFFSFSDSRVLSTVTQLEDAFHNIYRINKRFSDLGTAMGRYPEDQYTGYESLPNGGNPWVLITNGFAEYYYRLAKQLIHKGRIRIRPYNQKFYRRLLPNAEIKNGDRIEKGSPLFDQAIAKLNTKADNFLKRVRMHANPDGTFSEQMNKFHGYQQGAQNLTWSYSSYITAMKHRP